jgi:hypothetical protein
LEIIKNQYDTAQQLYEKLIAYLTDIMNTLKQKYDTLYERRQLEYEGFSTDYRQIRERVRQLESVIVAIKSQVQPYIDEHHHRHPQYDDRLIVYWFNSHHHAYRVPNMCRLTYAWHLKTIIESAIIQVILLCHVVALNGWKFPFPYLLHVLVCSFVEPL